VAIGIPIPVLNEEICSYAAVKDEDIYAPIVDYGKAYPERDPETLGEVSYARLKSGAITINGKKVSTSPLSSYYKAREIAANLKQWIEEGVFLLTEPASALPGPDSGYGCGPLVERPIQNDRR
jgi:uncharacterized protein (DUF39 family)